MTQQDVLTALLAAAATILLIPAVAILLTISVVLVQN